jgi:quercetin dioxygenase-like cupin family protein
MRAKISTRLLKVLLVCGAVVLVAAAVYAASPLWALGTEADGTHVYIGQVSLPPGNHSSWHYHAGDYYLVVTQGVIVEEFCEGLSTVYYEGDVMNTPPGTIHRISNGGKQDAQGAFFTTWPTEVSGYYVAESCPDNH